MPVEKVRHTGGSDWRGLFISSFPFNFYPVNNDCFCLIVYGIKDAVVTHTDTIAFFLCKFFRAMQSRMKGKCNDGIVNTQPIFDRDFFCLFLSSFFYYNFISQPFKNLRRNFSYGVNEVASRSDLSKSLASSRSSSNPMIFLYSLRLMTTAFF